MSAASQLIPFRFQPGQSGNPNGRAKGSRNKLGEQFLADLRQSWEAHGNQVIAAVIRDNPVAYLKVVAMVTGKDDFGGEESLTRDRVRQAIAVIESWIGAAGAQGAGVGSGLPDAARELQALSEAVRVP